MTEHFHFRIERKFKQYGDSSPLIGFNYERPAAERLAKDLRYAKTFRISLFSGVAGVSGPEYKTADVKSVKIVVSEGYLLPDDERSAFEVLPAVSIDEILNPAKFRQVFVVHGRNLPMRAEVVSLLAAMGLDVISWSDAREKTRAPNPSALDIVRAGMHAAQAVVVLLTAEERAGLLPELAGDDDGDEMAIKGQPRPNVLVEAGMAVATAPQRTVIVQVGPIRVPSDLGGMMFVRLTDNPDGRRELRDALKSAGCALNPAEGWDSTGDFESAVIGVEA